MTNRPMKVMVDAGPMCIISATSSSPMASSNMIVAAPDKVDTPTMCVPNNCRAAIEKPIMTTVKSPMTLNKSKRDCRGGARMIRKTRCELGERALTWRGAGNRATHVVKPLVDDAVTVYELKIFEPLDGQIDLTGDDDRI